jgi:hypothetical protein
LSGQNTDAVLKPWPTGLVMADGDGSFRCLPRSSPEPDDKRKLYHAEGIPHLARPALLAFQDVIETDDIISWFPNFCFLPYRDDDEKFPLRSGMGFAAIVRHYGLQ